MHYECRNCEARAKVEPQKRYQLVIMAEEGKCYCMSKFYDFENVQKAMREVRELYEKHGITHHVGYREV